MEHDHHNHDSHDVLTTSTNSSFLETTITTVASTLLDAFNATLNPHSMHDHHHMHDDTSANVSGTENSVPSHNHDMHSGHDSTGHAMAFHFGHNQVLFFNAWNINSPITLIYACVGIFVFSVLYEGLKVFREHLMSHPPFANARKGLGSPGRHKKNCCSSGARTHHDEGASAYAKMNNAESRTPTHFAIERGFKSCDCRSSPAFSILDHGLQSILHIIQTGLGFMLMLIFMTFNVWMCLALLLGAGVGYFCFAWKRKIAIVDVTQHCN